jgi:hypothetical protein
MPEPVPIRVSHVALISLVPQVSLVPLVPLKLLARQTDRASRTPQWEHLI